MKIISRIWKSLRELGESTSGCDVLKLLKGGKTNEDSLLECHKDEIENHENHHIPNLRLERAKIRRKVLVFKPYFELDKTTCELLMHNISSNLKYDGKEMLETFRRRCSEHAEKDVESRCEIGVLFLSIHLRVYFNLRILNNAFKEQLGLKLMLHNGGYDIILIIDEVWALSLYINLNRPSPYARSFAVTVSKYISQIF